MDREAIARRLRAAATWLWQTAPAQPRLSAWAWAADAILAVLLATAAVSGALQHQDVMQRDGPIHIFVPEGAPAPVAPGPPEWAPGPRDRLQDGPPGELEPWQLAVAALSALPLATRRRFPLASFWVITFAALYVYTLNGDPTWTVVASVVAAYSAPTYSRYRNLALVSVVLAAVLVVGGNRDNLPGLPSGLVTFLLLSSVGLAANAIHTWRQRARTLEQEREAATRLAVDRERARLARELHDVVSHNVSVMVVQAGAARKVMDSAPEQAKEALLAVEAGGRAAMTELRQVIGLLTVDNDGVDLAPQPGLDGLEALVARVRETGVPVTLQVAAGDVPPGVGLAAYRVVQEALTNAVKHAAGAEVRIDVTQSDSVLRVEVTDTGGAPAVGSGSGRGLIGLRERLEVYGGTLTTGHRPTGGFRVVAEIPVNGGDGGDV
ncbi:hypothetical protein GCM10010399_93920 [Dactylosporangium fulvum]|uniref:histidine kinase n=1 Tax=Dactylosporangium fulvum TaxID=53359 RepID=A0ABY5VPI3_9ACTN|nr:sensor histidine kinase [Dactylosporangium fulvum]UWP79077.1 sensor histidine kinase [Dactylosporangium fulvum]